MRRNQIVKQQREGGVCGKVLWLEGAWWHVENAENGTGSERENEGVWQDWRLKRWQGQPCRSSELVTGLIF